jgi:TP901 family phage tail tape measure protein
MSNVMEIIVRAVDQASNVLNNIGKQGEQATKNLEKSFQNAGKAMTKAGKTLSTHVTAPLAGLATVSVATVAKFDDSMSQVAAISGATGNDLERLRDLAKDLGATTRYSASQAADAMTYLALAGYDTNQILSATPGMLNLAAAAGMDLATAADIVTDTMSGFQMSAERAGEAADIFAAASSKSNTNVEQLGEAMKYASSTANAAGMDLAQTAAILGVFADSGVKGSMAGTTFNAILRDMRNKAKDGAIAIGDMSIALYNADGTMRDLGSIMADVEQATKNMTTAQRDAALSAVFGSEAMRGVNILLATGSERYKELEQAMYNSTGTSQKMAKTMEDNVAGTFRALKSQMEGIMIQIGEQLAPILRDTIIPLLSSFGEKISNLIKWFAGLDEGTKRTIITILGIVAAVGPVLVFLGKVVGAIGTMIGIFTKLKTAWAAVTTVSNLFNASLLANPITWVIVGIMALIAAIVLLWKNWDTVSQWLSNSWEWIKKTAMNIFQGIADFFTGIWEGIKNVVTEVWGAITEFFINTWENIKQIFNKALEAIKNVINNVWNSVKNVTSTVWNGIVSVITGIVNGIKNAIGTAFNWIKNTITNVWNGVKNTTKSIWDSMVTIIKAPVNGIISIINGLIGALNKVKINIPKVPDWIPGIGGKGGGSIGFNIPKIPYLARGGFIRGGNPTPAVIGEGRYDEAVIPLSDSVLSKLAEMIASRIGTPAVAGADGGVFVVEVPVYLDSREIARATTPHISKNLMRQQLGRDSARGRR